ncbi:hypothetical protein [Rhodanobacter sp. UC4451_H18]
MTERDNFEKYQASMADWTSWLMSSKGKGIPEASDFSEQELELLNEVFRRFAEISQTMDNLELCLSFIGARTPRREGLKLDAYLNYHITFYLQEIYILKERLKTHAIKTMRLRKRLGHSIDRGAYKKLIDTVEQSLSPIVSVRGSHVHDRPFTDDDMKMLGAYSFLAVQRPDDPNWSRYARAEYSEVKQTWVERLGNNQKELKKLLDVFCSFLHAEVFEGGLLTVPNKSSKRTREKPRAA